MKSKLKIAIGLISLGLLATLIYKLTEVPGGMFLSGLFLGGMVVALILVGGLTLTWLTKLIFKRLQFWTVYYAIIAIAFAVFHYQLYSPTLKIIVPENYTGQISLVKSNVTENILTVDSNGIGYLNEWTFSKLYSKPIVIDENGKDLNERCVGFNPSTFFGLGTSASSEKNGEIKSLSFEIVPKDKIGEKQYYNTNLSELVDKKKIK
ncbi:hypothetical protein [Arcticibacterium luteifluviistationis]|uniref:Uncharacterized protein n=1 Tax=Arcticibacterium luteifluviistationis TaxID=1784714 RepID=A0A2Z4G7L8_9BACT|nr:hypothetical protein [Arcticibacterium luteifluviistationis]AWV97162.1 hypothetical protein DJ013_02820 [Arcticibacterium luteifluviistationis]